jgi:hypothetical protein
MLSSDILWKDVGQFLRDYGTVLGIVIGVITLIISLSRASAVARTQHTFNALLQMSFNDRYQTALEAVRPYFDMPLPDDLNTADEHKKLRNHVLLLLNYYQFLSAGVRHGTLSEDLLRTDQRYLVERIYIICEGFIKQRRAKANIPGLFSSLEWLHKRWIGK